MSKMMKNESITIDKRTLEFLLFSYFGKAKSAVEAAINVAYRDMAAHTLTKKANDERKDSDDWKKRKEAAKSAAYACIEKALNSLNVESYDAYDNWHRNLCKTLNSAYNEKDVKLTFGQAQKWVNMTMKYLYMFYLLENSQAMENVNKELKEKYKLGQELKDIIGATNLYYHVPLDNYILKRLYQLLEEERIESQLKSTNLKNDSETYKLEIDKTFYSWSRIPFDVNADGVVQEPVCKDYYVLQEELRKQLGEEKEPMLLWEFDNWIQVAMQK